MPLIYRFLVIFGLFIMITPALADRVAPKPVSPVVLHSVEYSAPSTDMGVVIATDIQSRKELWRKRIYTVRYDPALERDVQDLFITKLVIKHEKLIVTNERGDQYLLDLTTRKVTQ